MNRFLGLAFVAWLIAGCGVSGSPSAPMASLKVPVCVAVPQEVLFDASASTDVDGDIERFIFEFGHRYPALVVDVPRVSYRLAKAYRVDGVYRPMPVTVTVVDSNGLEGTVSAQMWVVDDIEECAGLGGGDPSDVTTSEDQQSPADAVETDGTVHDTLSQDLLKPDLQDAIWVDMVEVQDLAGQDAYDMAGDLEPEVIPPEDLILDTAPDQVNPDVIEPCPTLGQKYSVKVRCDGVVQAVLDLAITQVGCTVKDTFGIVNGSFNGTTLTLTSTFTELKIQECSGSVEQIELFTLGCSSGCSAEYSLAP